MESTGTTMNPKSTIRTEKLQSRMRGPFFLWINVLAAMPFMFGCGYSDKVPSHFQKISGRANAFRLLVLEPGPLDPREHVKKIQVFEGHYGGFRRRPPGQICWEVVAAPPVRAKGIEDVVAGQIPERFRQVVPPPPETFKPVPGKRYSISVTIAHPQAWPYVLTPWKAE